MEQRQAGGESFLNAFHDCTLNLGDVPEVVQKGYLAQVKFLPTSQPTKGRGQDKHRIDRCGLASVELP